MIDRAVLDAVIQAGEVDTVIVAFPDQQGRLMGKRVTGRHFREHVADEGIHACDYLLTTDMQMEPLPGYLLASWDRGYGDVVIKPDWSTARRLPWLPGTALLIGDAQFDDGRVVDVFPRAVLRAQIAEASKLGIRLKVASELEGYLFGDSYAEADAKGYRGIRRVSRYLEDYHVFQGTREEPILRPLRNHMEAAGVPMEGTKGEWGRGQVELNLAYADALEMADRHVILKHGAREISEQQGGSITFMAKYGPDEAGSSCHIHASAWDLGGTSNLFWSDGPSDLFGHFLAGQLALANELALFFAPTVNSYKRYQSLSWAPTAITWVGTTGRAVSGSSDTGHRSGLRTACRVLMSIPTSRLPQRLARACMGYGTASSFPIRSRVTRMREAPAIVCHALFVRRFQVFGKAISPARSLESKSLRTTSLPLPMRRTRMTVRLPIGNAPGTLSKSEETPCSDHDWRARLH